MKGVFIMRIENIQMVAQLYDKKSISKQKKTSDAGSTDQLEISQAGKDFQVARKAVKESEDVREDLVKEIKSRINSGEYSVSGEDFAAKVIDRYNQFML